MRILELYQDYHIDHITEDHKHAREGWVNIECPFCTGNPGYHLGFNLDANRFHCWRCGGKFPEQVISKILSVSYSKAEDIVKEYGGISKRSNKKPKVKVNLHPFKFPSGDLSLTKYHKQYLEKRNFDPDRIISQYGLKGTGPISKLDDLNYSRRILAPIYWQSRMVSFQARDITDKHPLKYMACPQRREEIQHQHILYGAPILWGRRGICVEGITDVWRMGYRSFAVFGIKYTPYQVKQIASLFDEVVILFDPEKQAQREAKSLEAELNFRGIKAWRYNDIHCDPGDLSQDDADHLTKEILK